MNWYKQVKLAQSFGRSPNTYMDIGHYDDPESDCEEWLWVYDQGNVLTEEGVPGSLHQRYWPIQLLDNTWSGRYDSCKKQISIGVPPALTHRQIPTAIIRILQRKFPEAVGTYVFAPGSAPQAV